MIYHASMGETNIHSYLSSAECLYFLAIGMYMKRKTDDRLIQAQWFSAKI